MSRIVRVAARGEGVSQDGRHVAFAAPGDTLTDAGEVVPGPHRRVPPCRHFPTCGGCQLQHLDDDAYRAFVTDRITSALAAQNLSAPVREVALSPERTRRRATLHAEAKGGRVLLGFAAQKSHAIVDMAECHVLLPDIFALVAPLRGLLQRLGLKRRADVQVTMTDRGADVLIAGVAPEGLAAAEAVTAFAERHGVARLSFDDGFGPETRWEPQPVTITLGGTPVPFPPGGFLQATAEGEGALVAAVREAVGTPATTADLFAGLGTFTLALPGKVYAAEGARDAVISLKAAANTGQRPIFTEHRDLYRRPLTVTELDRFGAIVLDPPRAGARDQAEALANSRAPVIAYVSCNPSSFARDAALLVAGGWSLDWVRPVGQFRWSTHVELAARFTRPDQ
ncbi:23S rRNA m(5)U-1939 methyltransferase [Sphingomonas gellani]|uniref:23S rRNA m(5)U-1939 methyltransferase n=1 Tax=Sphingomonas gellani TaxID=1166340 RepID=A0A1H7ZSK8_9SPHN|nr:class I SAM-dependent RNA methyltransferase [Sphingomonas gellani]SEM61632.1 23S rRNA m(5)U-1939 methyltransferase [Sphingomonas gellani]